MLGIKRQPDRLRTGPVAAFRKFRVTTRKIEDRNEEERLKERFVLFSHYGKPPNRDDTDHDIFLKKETLRVEKMIELLTKERARVLKTLKTRTLLEKMIARITKQPTNQNLRNVETHLKHLQEERSIIRFEKTKLHLQIHV